MRTSSFMTTASVSYGGIVVDGDLRSPCPSSRIQPISIGLHRQVDVSTDTHDQLELRITAPSPRPRLPPASSQRRLSDIQPLSPSGAYTLFLRTTKKRTGERLIRNADASPTPRNPGARSGNRCRSP